eukprot:14868629-Ditylum_brightwellii.AAC.1
MVRSHSKTEQAKKLLPSLTHTNMRIEFIQLHQKEAFQPMKPNKLMSEQKKGAFKFLMFITKKQCSGVKARGCADKRKQRDLFLKEEAASPTVSSEA